MDEATVDKFQMKLFSKVFGPMIKEQVLFALFTKSEKKVILQTKKDAVESLRKFDNGSLADIIDDYEKAYMEAVTVEKITEMDHLAETFGKNSLTAQYRKSSGDNVVKIVRQCHESKHLVGEFRFMTNFRNQADISAWRFMECQFDVEEAGTRRDAVEGHR